jgi:hypothetical protein
MRIVAERCLLGELFEGELYSHADQVHWDFISNPPLGAGASGIGAMPGHQVFIRSGDILPDDMANQVVFRITVERDGGTPETQ